MTDDNRKGRTEQAISNVLQATFHPVHSFRIGEIVLALAGQHAQQYRAFGSEASVVQITSAHALGANQSPRVPAGPCRLFSRKKCRPQAEGPQREGDAQSLGHLAGFKPTGMPAANPGEVRVTDHERDKKELGNGRPTHVLAHHHAVRGDDHGGSGEHEVHDKGAAEQLRTVNRDGVGPTIRVGQPSDLSWLAGTQCGSRDLDVVVVRQLVRWSWKNIGASHPARKQQTHQQWKAESNVYAAKGFSEPTLQTRALLWRAWR